MKENQLWYRWRLCIVALFVLSSLQYALTLKNDFVWDSEMAIVEDPTIRDYHYLPSYFTEDTLKHTVKEKSGSIITLKYYRPFLKVFYLLEYKIFGPNPAGYHAVNILLNAFVVVLCFLFVLEITGNVRIAFVSSLLYTVNPTRAEAVNWVNSVSSILMALFCMLSLLFYHRRRYRLSLISFATALFMRETAILLPVILVLYEIFIGKQKRLRGYRRVLPFFVLVGVYLWVRQVVVGMPPITDVDIFTQFNTVAVIFKRFVKIFFLPDAPVTIYTAELFSAVNFEVVISYIVVAGLLLSGIFLWLKKRDYLFWYIWFFAWTALSLNVGKFADYLMAEKGLYIASLGFCVLIASWADNLHAKNIKNAIKIVLISGIVIAHSVITFSRSFYWKDTITYLEKAVEFAPQFDQAHYVLANKYASNGEYERALVEYKKTIILSPNHSMAYNNIGNIYYIMGDIGASVISFKKAIQSDPENPQPYYNIGFIMEQEGDIQSALSYFKRFLLLSPKPPLLLADHITELEAMAKGK